MGNYCCKQGRHQENNNYRKKVSIQSNSTVVSQFNSVGSMKKHSYKLLKYLKQGRQNRISFTTENIEELQVVSEIGKGGQSKVFEVILKGSSKKQEPESFEQKKIAVKRTNLKKQQHSLNSILISKTLLHQNVCPFLVSSYFSFSCQKYFYSAMKVAQGGDLTSFLQKWRGKGEAFRKLGQNGIRLVTAGIVIGLQYLHGKGLIYCDLKTDNVLIDSDGYPLLTDFQLVSEKQQIPVDQFFGTITSMGPEIHTESFVDKGVDLWSLGVLLYFITYSTIPYTSSVVQNPIFIKEVKRKEGKHKERYKQVSGELENLINSLLKLKPSERLGYRSISEIKNHEFFADMDWEKYNKKQIANPIRQIIKKFPLKEKKRRTGKNKEQSMLVNIHSQCELIKKRKYTD